MNKKFTLLIIPDDDSGTKSYNFSKNLLKFLIISMSIILIVFIIISIKLIPGIFLNQIIYQKTLNST